MTMARPGDALGRALRWAAGGEWVVVGMAAPVLAFPTVRPRWTAGALAALAAVWVFRWAVRGEPWPVTPFNGALLLFSVMIPVGMWASAFPEFTLPKAAGLVLGLATFRAVAFAVDDGRRLGLAVAGFCLLGLGIAAVGALGTQWKATVAPLAALAEQVPRLIPTLPELRSAGINPNQLAALLTLYVPFALALAVGVPFRRGTGLAARVVWLVVLGALTAVMAGLLLLTQSRSGWMGGAAGLVALHVYGLIDALALGAKPGVTFWYGLGLVVGTGPGAPGEERAR